MTSGWSATETEICVPAAASTGFACSCSWSTSMLRHLRSSFKLASFFYFPNLKQVLKFNTREYAWYPQPLQSHNIAHMIFSIFFQLFKTNRFMLITALVAQLGNLVHQYRYFANYEFPAKRLTKLGISQMPIKISKSVHRRESTDTKHMPGKPMLYNRCIWPFVYPSPTAKFRAGCAKFPGGGERVLGASPKI